MAHDDIMMMSNNRPHWLNPANSVVSLLVKGRHESWIQVLATPLPMLHDFPSQV